MTSPMNSDDSKSPRSLNVTVLGGLVFSILMFSRAQIVAGDSQVAHHSVPENGMERAGNPRCISPLAKCFPDMKYKGFYVGGGAAWYHTKSTAFRGESRMPHEGTFGVDYAPWYSRVQQRWFHGRKQQGGEGQYESDAYNNPLDDHLGFGRYKKAPWLFPHHH